MSISINSPVIIGFLALSFIAMGLNYVTGGATNKMIFSSSSRFTLSPVTILRLFTHSLGSAGFSHFFSNAMPMLLIGPVLEEKYGSLDLLALFFISAFMTAFFNHLFFKNRAILGASGIVFSLIGASSVAGMTNDLTKIPLTLILVIILYGSKEVAGIFLEPEISNASHLIGLAVGILFGLHIASGGVVVPV